MLFSRNLFQFQKDVRVKFPQFHTTQCGNCAKSLSASAAHFSCLKFFAKNEINAPFFCEKRKIHEKSIIVHSLPHSYVKTKCNSMQRKEPNLILI